MSPASSVPTAVPPRRRPPAGSTSRGGLRARPRRGPPAAGAASIAVALDRRAFARVETGHDRGAPRVEGLAAEAGGGARGRPARDRPAGPRARGCCWSWAWTRASSVHVQSRVPFGAGLGSAGALAVAVAAAGRASHGRRSLRRGARGVCRPRARRSSRDSRPRGSRRSSEGSWPRRGFSGRGSSPSPRRGSGPHRGMPAARGPRVRAAALPSGRGDLRWRRAGGRRPMRRVLAPGRGRGGAVVGRGREALLAGRYGELPAFLRPTCEAWRAGAPRASACRSTAWSAVVRGAGGVARPRAGAAGPGPGLGGARASAGPGPRERVTRALQAAGPTGPSPAAWTCAASRSRTREVPRVRSIMAGLRRGKEP